MKNIRERLRKFILPIISNKIAIISFTIVVVAISLISYYNSQLGSVSNKDETIVFEIKSGESFDSVLSDLKANGLIKNEMIAKIYARLNGLTEVQANSYILNSNMGVKEILNVIHSGNFDYLAKLSITFQEGLNIKEVAKRLAEKTIYSDDEIIAYWANKTYLNSLIDDYWFLDNSILGTEIKFPLEGYLYPNTYIFSSDSLAIDVYTRAMLNEMNEQLSPLKDAIQATGMTVHEFLAFTSVVEQEGLHEQDKKMIAGVLYNRIANNMPFQCDVTVFYVLGKNEFNNYLSDVKIDDKYNTYKYLGAPIGPISNVSIVTMDAVLNYTRNDYLYFFAKQYTGEIIFTKTLSEHEKVAKENAWR